jgi:hypothetical protein
MLALQMLFNTASFGRNYPKSATSLNFLFRQLHRNIAFTAFRLFHRTIGFKAELRIFNICARQDV